MNLAWLLLALGAYAALRSSRSIIRKNRFGTLQAWLALGCVLFVLFPVISATDDVHAMRAEVEESPVGKRSMRSGACDKCNWNTRLQSPPAALPDLSSPETFVVCIRAAESRSVPLRSTIPSFAAGRAPPALLPS